MRYEDFHRRSITDRDGFWGEQARLIDWETPPQTICDYSNPPFARWFVGGRTNLCHNAVDRHLRDRADQNALIYVSTETDQEQAYSFRELHAEVMRMAAILQSLGVRQSDRVLIYMPMVPQAVFAMLACARIGAIHSVVFGGFASVSLASRIDDARPTVIVSADAGSRGGKVVAYKPLLDEAIRLAQHKPSKVLLVDRGLAPMERVEGRDVDYAALREQHLDAQVQCTWVEATHPSYTLYTSGTTGRPKGVQRDTGGYAVALAASMRHIFCGNAGETYFSTSDIGWVVGHSYIVYGPLIAGMATILYEGLPIRPDAGIWWRLVEKYKVTVMFSAPTAVRVLKKQDPAWLTKYDLSSLRALFLAGEPLDEPTARWIADALGRPVIDNYWQTETGWPILTIANGVEPRPSRFGSPGVPMYGYDVKLLHEVTGEELTGPNQKGVVAIEGPLPPGCMQTVWGDDARFVSTYWSSFPGRMAYSTFDWGIRDADGYYFILGRTDDVINVAGHRLGTREIEECISSHPAVAEVAVVGVADSLKGQVAMAFAVPKDAGAVETPQQQLQLEGDIMKLVDQKLGAVARPARVRFVTVLPKTRSGKLLRRAIQAVCEHRDPGDLTTIEDPTALEQIKALVASA
ncbi:propionate--CoA ligase [Caldimonas thermodepolymerans]|uniref:Propionate--CoA ligase n=1 Tax=Caldimonas thermodepolymerans TaxID=215580 RepID=A0A2S5T0J0_9BURK|nr:propionate--CoA ligase [Caldimonas thermodepolymerans]PPE68367.1 propionate--CoA ligase [Caldimonas thermodepolymerans]QPC30151.1 propionate--CoA ligase [Caldimonas thermodepolymerans]RDI00532.1 propionyl-CoA synthetase [Caldimonas thermodepolymerans]TCP07189.1 propionyl-CoA synthetase [Caldimonas thermodepolymerans]UZG46571.1 propionate--CoA ligase [Caldimonas thermodepolymerans]